MEHEPFEQMLKVGGKTNSLGRVSEVIAFVLSNNYTLDELFSCIKHRDPWVRMRAIDAFEKICRQHPDWIIPYINQLQSDFSGDDMQPSIKWHLAEIYVQVPLNHKQKERAIDWLMKQISTTEVDWIVAANCMKALFYFSQTEDVTTDTLIHLLEIQQNHSSKSIAKKASTMKAQLQNT